MLKVAETPASLMQMRQICIQLCKDLEIAIYVALFLVIYTSWAFIGWVYEDCAILRTCHPTLILLNLETL